MVQPFPAFIFSCMKLFKKYFGFQKKFKLQNEWAIYFCLIFIQDIYEQIYVEEVVRDGSKDLTYFEHKKVMYLWNHADRNFEQVRYEPK